MLRLHIVWAAAGWLMGGLLTIQTRGKKIIQKLVLKISRA